MTLRYVVVAVGLAACAHRAVPSKPPIVDVGAPDASAPEMQREAASSPRGVLIPIADDRSRDVLYRISPDGTVTRVWPARDVAPIGSGAAELGVGSGRMRPSRDGTHVAYVDDGALEIRRVADGVTTEVFRAPKKDDLILITDWAPVDRELLFAVKTRLPGNPDDEVESYEEPKFFRHDLRTGTTTPFSMPGEYHGWFPSGEMLIIAGNETFLFAEGKRRALSTDARPLHQTNICADGSRVVAMASAGDGVQLVAIDPRTQTSKPLDIPHAWGDVQWPKLSPSCRKVGSIAFRRIAGGRTQQAVVIDRQRVTDFAEDLRSFEWIDESTIAVIHTRDVVIMTARGELKRRAPVL